MGNTNRSNAESLRRVFETNQPMSADEIKAMMSPYGFHTKSQRGSHIKLEHGETGQVVIFPAGTTNPLYQKKAAKACLAINNIQHEPAPSKAKNGSSNGAEKTSPQKMFLSDAVPADIEVVNVPGCPSLVALRFASLPVTGIVASADKMVKSEIDRLLERYDEEINSFTVFLQSRIDEYKLVLRQEAEGYLLWQPGYELGLYIPQYDGANPKDVRTEITRFTDTIQEWDREFGGTINFIIGEFEKEDRVKKTLDENGMMHWTIRTTHNITGEEGILELTASPELRAPLETLHSFMDNHMRTELVRPADPKYYSKVLKSHYGLEVTRPDGKKPGSKLVIKHPFYPELSYTMPVPSEIPRIDKLCRQFDKTTDHEEAKRLQAISNQAILDMHECTEVNNQIKNDLLAILKKDLARYLELVKASMSMQGMSEHITGAEKPGDRGTISFSHPSFDRTVTVNIIKVQVYNIDQGKKTPTTLLYTICNPRDIDGWEQALKRAQANARPKLGDLIASPGFALQ